MNTDSKETEKQCDIHVVGSSMADKAQIINALINTMDINKNKSLLRCLILKPLLVY